MEDKNSAKFWKNIKKGANIILNEFYQMEDGITEFTVKKVERAVVSDRDGNSIVEFLFIRLKVETIEEKLLVVKLVEDEEVEVRIFEEDPNFESGSRETVINGGGAWLFEEPSDDDERTDDYDDSEYELDDEYELDGGNNEDQVENSTDLTDLQYVQAIENDDEVVFEQKRFGELQAEYYDDKGRNYLATIVEYSAQLDDEELAEYKNPEMVILEIGKHESDKGGLVKFFYVRYINSLDVEIYSG